MLGHLKSIGEGTGAFSLAVFAHFWSVAQPVLSGVTVLMGFMLAAHGLWSTLRHRPMPVIVQKDHDEP